MALSGRTVGNPRHTLAYLADGARSAALLWPLVVLLGCPGALDNPERFRPAAKTCTLQIDVEQDIMVARCGTTAGCHISGAGAASGLDLASADVVGRLKDIPELSCTQRPLISSANPSASVLLDRLQPTPSCASRMPLTGTPLTQEEIDCVEIWLADSLTGTTASSLEAGR